MGHAVHLFRTSLLYAGKAHSSPAGNRLFVGVCVALRAVDPCTAIGRYVKATHEVRPS